MTAGGGVEHQPRCGVVESRQSIGDLLLRCSGVRGNVFSRRESGLEIRPRVDGVSSLRECLNGGDGGIETRLVGCGRRGLVALCVLQIGERFGNLIFCGVGIRPDRFGRLKGALQSRPAAYRGIHCQLVRARRNSRRRWAYRGCKRDLAGRALSDRPRGSWAVCSCFSLETR